MRREMGANHSAYPLKFFERDDGFSWLRSCGIELPSPLPPSRDPTPDELRAVLDHLVGCRVEYTVAEDEFDADVSNTADESDGAVIWVNYKGGPKDQPLEHIFFHRGSKEMVLRIVGGLARLCGPFAVAFNQEEWHLVTE